MFLFQTLMFRKIHIQGYSIVVVRNILMFLMQFFKVVYIQSTACTSSTVCVWIKQ